MATYIDLVNSAIRESGIDIDEIESADFASPTDKMQVRFKNWVAQAWKEIQLERNEWEWQSAQYQGIIYPRVLVVEGDRSTAPPADSIFEGDDTDARFTVLSTPTLISGAWGDGDAVAWIDYSTLTGNFKFNEQFDEIDPTPANLNVFRVKWWGRYDLVTDAGNALEPNLDSFFIQSTGGSSLQTNDSSTDNTKLIYVPWAQFVQTMEWDEVSRGKPVYVTTTPEGYYDFWPRPDEGYVLTFTYTKTPEILSSSSDTPTGLNSIYHDMIFWRAVMYYADYENRSDIFLRAEKRHNYYKTRLERNEMPVMDFSRCRYDLIRY